MLLMIDNYDSFTFNLVQYLQVLGAEVQVVRNDAMTVEEIERLAPQRIVISPGPCTPNEAGVSLQVIERYSHVMHIVSEVTGELLDGLNYTDVLRAAFPAGTVSGSPKVRALEIIRELEPVKRNVYAGSIGYIGWHGDADTAIAIRTAVIKDGRLHVQAGAGIVYDSDPQKEWEETMNKGRALFRAVAQAAKGL